MTTPTQPLNSERLAANISYTHTYLQAELKRLDVRFRLEVYRARADRLQACVNDCYERDQWGLLRPRPGFQPPPRTVF